MHTRPFSPNFQFCWHIYFLSVKRSSCESKRISLVWHVDPNNEQTIILLYLEGVSYVSIGMTIYLNLLVKLSSFFHAKLQSTSYCRLFWEFFLRCAFCWFVFYFCWYYGFIFWAMVPSLFVKSYFTPRKLYSYHFYKTKICVIIRLFV